MRYRNDIRENVHLLISRRKIIRSRTRHWIRHSGSLGFGPKIVDTVGSREAELFPINSKCIGQKKEFRTVVHGTEGESRMEIKMEHILVSIYGSISTGPQSSVGRLRQWTVIYVLPVRSGVGQLSRGVYRLHIVLKM